MSDTEKFMFDLQGYLHVPSFLRPDEVQAINDAFDANWHLRRIGAEATKRQGYDQFYGMLEWEQPYCQIFRDLLAHPKIVPYLNTMFGRGWKVDHEPFMLTGTAEMSAARNAAGDGGMSVHGGTAHHFQGHSYYEYNNGQIRNGLSNCVYMLRDINEGDGGIGFVPGECSRTGPCHWFFVSLDLTVLTRSSFLAGSHLRRLAQGKLCCAKRHRRERKLWANFPCGKPSDEGR